VINTYKAKILKVIDGDTIDVDIDLGFSIVLHKQRIRLYGIDTPESRTSDKEEKIYGLMSKNYLKKYCPKGSTITLETTLDKKGKFGRILGTIIVNALPKPFNINKRMIKEHLAVEYYGQSKEDIEQQHLVNRKKVGATP
jgi:micrococcal nuclease